MKKLCCVVASVLLLACLGMTAVAETELVDYYCAEEGYTTKVPVNGSAGYREGTGLQIYLDIPGYPPYVIVSRRPLDMKFSNPENFLNNIFREYMEERYGDGTGMNPARVWEIGGKNLLGARYMYKASDYSFVLLRLIEVRDDGDVEYTAVYPEGKDDAVADALDAAVRYYQPDDAKAQDTGKNDQTTGKLLTPEAISENLDSDNGIFWARIPDPERILDGGYFTAMLYMADLYPKTAVESLTVGDQVLVHGQTLTVQSMVPHQDGELELYPEEDFNGYVVFQSYSDTHYSVLVNDCTLVSHVADKKIMMPLPNDFSYSYLEGGGDITSYDADTFVSMVAKGDDPGLSEYNTLIVLQDGLVINITHADYPAGLEE